MENSESKDLIQKLDRDIARYIKLTYDTRLERNSLLPVSRLPTEVLCRIFLILRDITSWPFNKISPWIHVSHVCVRWRNAALGESTLWTTPSLDTPFWAITMMERSRMAGITIAIDPHIGLSVILLVVQHFSHVTKLTLHYQSLHEMQRVLQLLAHTPTPMLEILSVGFGHIHQITQEALFRRIPSNAIIAAPRLRHLKLRYINFDWSHPLYSALTTLFLEDIALTRRPSMAQLVSVLREMPELRYLTLRHALPVGDLDAQHDQDEHQWPIVPLPQLEVVTLVGDFPQLHAFTRVVALSSSISLIELTFLHNNHFELGNLISDLTEAYCASTTHRHACLERYDPYAAIDLIFSPYSETSRLQISINQFIKPDRDYEVLDLDCDEKIYSHFFHSFNWTSLVRLNLNSLPSASLPSARLVALTFGSLSGIKTVVVSLSTASFFIDVLLLGLDSGSTPGNSSDILIPFPGLRKIEMINVSFFKQADELSSDNNDGEDTGTHDCEGSTPDEEDSQEEDDDDSEDDDVPINTAEFIRCLEDRTMKGVPIRKLRLQGRTIISEGDKQSLRDTVSVDWGIFDSESDSDSETESKQIDGDQREIAMKDEYMLRQHRIFE